MASLSLPSLNLPSLGNLLALLGAMLAIQMALGINLGMPGAGLKLSAMLSAVAALQLPAFPAPGVSLAVLAGLDLKALAALNLGGLIVPSLNIGPLSLVASLAANAKLALGINLLAAGCPVCKLLG
jgi:hypothetical protein